ncbi:MAG: restriction endonuclease subunit S [Eubacterium sp.]|nr:restriction endonuclease subunit S [Eubacterium sp.]
MRYKLGEICEIVSGSTPKTSVSEYWDGDIKWITPAELNDDSYIVSDSVRKITELGVEKTGLSPFPEGTVILSSRAPIGKVAIAGCEMYCNQGFKNLICSEKINNKYLYWFLKGNTDYLNSLGRGATFREISKQIVSSIEINVPDVDLQLEVVRTLEMLSRVIQLRKKEVESLDNLIKARFVELFGDVICNEKRLPAYALSDISESRLGKMLDAKQQTGEHQRPYLANFNVQWFRFDFSQLNEMDFNEADRKEFELQEGDLLVTEGGEVGRCAVWKNEIPFCYLNQIPQVRDSLSSGLHCCIGGVFLLS